MHWRRVHFVLARTRSVIMSNTASFTHGNDDADCFVLYLRPFGTVVPRSRVDLLSQITFIKSHWLSDSGHLSFIKLKTLTESVIIRARPRHDRLVITCCRLCRAIKTISNPANFGRASLRHIFLGSIVCWTGNSAGIGVFQLGLRWHECTFMILE